jgi:hypothetical protein
VRIIPEGDEFPKSIFQSILSDEKNLNLKPLDYYSNLNPQEPSSNLCVKQQKESAGKLICENNKKFVKIKDIPIEGIPIPNQKTSKLFTNVLQIRKPEVLVYLEFQLPFHLNKVSSVLQSIDQNLVESDLSFLINVSLSFLFLFNFSGHNSWGKSV